MTNGNTAGPSGQISPVAAMHDFSAFIAQGAAAIERLPQVEAERDAALHSRNDAQHHSEGLELRIAGYKAEVSDLHAKLREAEAARDTFRQQALDNASQRDRLVSAFATAAGMVEDEVRQIVPQPEPTPEPVQEVHTEPTADSVNVPITEQAHEPGTGPAYGDGRNLSPQDQTTQASPYAGKRYTDFPHYISRKDWLTGGGTDADYDWRPTTTSF